MNELTNRQKQILWVVIKEYIDSAQPVGSSNILCKNDGLECSSATVRKELSVLEDDGFLVQPHTSAGRVPTDKGYRFYIDNLMKVYRMTAREKSLVEQLQRSLDRDMHNIMQDTLKTINSISNYATVIKTDNKVINSLIGRAKDGIVNTQRESMYLTGSGKDAF